MKKSNENIDELFRDGLSGYTETPPTDVWDALEKRLDGRKRRAGFYLRRPWFFLLLSFVVLLSATILWKMPFPQGTESNTIAKAEAPAATANSNITIQQNIPPVNSQAPEEHSNTTTKKTTRNKKQESRTVIENSAGEIAKPVQEPADNRISVAEIETKETISEIAKPKTKHLHTDAAKLLRIAKAKPFKPMEESNEIGINKPKTKKPVTILASSAKRNATIPTVKEKIAKPILSEDKKPVAEKKEPAIDAKTIVPNTGNIATNTVSEKTAEPKQTEAPILAAASQAQAKSMAMEHNMVPSSQQETVSQDEGKVAVNNAVGKESKDMIGAAANAGFNKENGDTTWLIHNRFGLETAVKTGFEGGFSKEAAQKFVLAYSMQYNFGDKLSFMTQPSIKLANINSRNLSGSQSFYSVNPDGNYTLDSLHNYLFTGSPDTFTFRYYTYTQSHDSIAKTYSFGGTYIEVELPLLLKYQLTKRLSIYGGVNIAYSKVADVTESTYRVTQSRMGAAVTVAPYSAPAPTPKDISQVITYTGTPISAYSGPLYPSSQGDLFRMGYTVGISYEMRKRWLLDATVQQSFVKQNMVGGYDLNNPYNLPYFRLMLGYKLTK